MTDTETPDPDQITTDDPSTVQPDADESLNPHIVPEEELGDGSER